MIMPESSSAKDKTSYFFWEGENKSQKDLKQLSPHLFQQGRPDRSGRKKWEEVEEEEEADHAVGSRVEGGIGEVGGLPVGAAGVSPRLLHPPAQSSMAHRRSLVGSITAAQAVRSIQQPVRIKPEPLRYRNTNKNRLSSTTCGEELQKIFKDWQSFKGLYQKVPKRFTNFENLCF